MYSIILINRFCCCMSEMCGKYLATIDYIGEISLNITPY